MANVLTILAHLPAVVDMDHWAMQTDLAVLCMLLVAPAGRSDDAIVAVRLQMSVFYLAAGVWKMTADHTDPQLSCSSLMLVQILCGWLPQWLLPTALLSLVVRAAPWVTLVVELGVGILLMSPRRALQRGGVLLALLLHTGIMVAPLPLSIADFSSMCASRLVWVVGNGAAKTMDELAANGGFRAFVRCYHSPCTPALADCRVPLGWNGSPRRRVLLAPVSQLAVAFRQSTRRKNGFLPTVRSVRSLPSLVGPCSSSRSSPCL